MSSVELVVGRIGKPHGIRGEVTVEVRTDDPDTRFKVGSVLAVKPAKGKTSEYEQLTVRSKRWHQGVLLLCFAEFADRNVAETARGLLLVVDVAGDDLGDEPDAFYEHQLVGLEVRNLDGEVIGKVTGLQTGTAQDLLQVKASDGRPALVPFVAALVPSVDVRGGFVVVADRPGLVSDFLPEDDDAAAAADED
ncbi:ribosome maturation factor RimM [Nocardioides yefusunii]|uniref:Ribosome maturation factor RimM n=1 Tax=Nocardioides yefusunii TaxID=2500546 RepID=A0ABW1QYL4_9ACTN|nr:ribosome maturation factor RimM [Nocardioides yefusunii]